MSTLYVPVSDRNRGYMFGAAVGAKSENAIRFQGDVGYGVSRTDRLLENSSKFRMKGAFEFTTDVSLSEVRPQGKSQ